MALRYRKPSLLWAHICLVCVCRCTNLCIYSDEMTGGAPFSQCSSFFSPLLQDHIDSIFQLIQNMSMLHWNNQRHNKWVIKLAHVVPRPFAQRTEGRIPFHLSDLFVSYLESCNGTQLGWNQVELINWFINEHRRMKGWACSFVKGLARPNNSTRLSWGRRCVKLGLCNQAFSCYSVELWEKKNWNLYLSTKKEKIKTHFFKCRYSTQKHIKVCGHQCAHEHIQPMFIHQLYSLW